jgi:hypothetical protein
MYRIAPTVNMPKEHEAKVIQSRLHDEVYMPRRETNDCIGSETNNSEGEPSQKEVHLKILGRRYSKHKLAFVIGD